MDRWQGKVAVVTGASSGIGAAIVSDLLQAGVTVVGLARRVDQVRSISDARTLHAIKCDVCNEADIVSAFAWIERTLGGVDILVNNAGVASETNLVDADNTALLRRVLETNVMGVALCTREAFQSMQRRKADAGHVVLINSICGHYMPTVEGWGSFNMYAPAKHAITAMTEVLRREFRNMQTRIKVTSISPGAVKTAMISEAFPFPQLNAGDISAAVMYAIGTPPHVQVHEITIKPVGEPY